jgi:hypothetical protein
LPNVAKQNPVSRKAKLWWMHEVNPVLKSGALLDVAKQNPVNCKAELCWMLRLKTLFVKLEL